MRRIRKEDLGSSYFSDFLSDMGYYYIYFSVFFVKKSILK